MNDAHQLKLSRQMEALLKAGLPLLEVIQIMELTPIETMLKKGMPLSDALLMIGFDSFCIGIIKISESTGELLNGFQEISQYLDKKIKLKQKFKKSLSYPLFVVFIASAVLMTMLQWVIPSFEDIFSTFSAQLPWQTRLLISISRWLEENVALLFFASTLIVVSSLFLWKTSSRFQKILDQTILRLPLFGNLQRRFLLSKWARNMSTLYAHGVPILEALRETACHSENWVIYALCSECHLHLSKGHSLSVALKNIKASSLLIRPETLQIIKIGEASGDLAGLLKQISIQEEESLDHYLDQLTQSLEPLLMVFMGLIVGALVIALYLPIFEMGQIL